MTTCDDLKLIRLIGNSAFSSTSVYLAQCHGQPTPKAVRVTDLELCSWDAIMCLQKELWASRSLNHVIILGHEVAFIEKRKLYVITDFMSYGACSDLLESYFHFGLAEPFIAYVLSEVLEALTYIHRLGYIHRGIKACHILVSGDGRVKLSGNRNMISMLDNEQRIKKVHDFPKHDTLLLPWLSPEILQQNMEGYDTLSDVYSLGITACELANGHAPFTDMPSTQMLLEKLNGTKPCLLDCSTVPDTSDAGCCENEETHTQHEVAKSKRFSDSFHDFISSCFTQNPRERPTALQLLSHPFIAKARTSKPNVQHLLSPLVPVTPDMQIPTGSETNDLTAGTKQINDTSAYNCEWDFEYP